MIEFSEQMLTDAGGDEIKELEVEIKELTEKLRTLRIEAALLEVKEGLENKEENNLEE